MGAQVGSKIHPCCMEEGLKSPLHPDCVSPHVSVGHYEKVQYNQRTTNLRYPMYVLPVQEVMELVSLETHEKLKSTDSLVDYMPGMMGDAIYVSHQWCHSEHPDPSHAQFRVLQAALRNLLEGTFYMQLHWLNQLSQTVPLVSQTIHGDMRVDEDWLTTVTVSQKAGQLSDNEMENLRAAYIWYDYMSVPQPHTRSKEQCGGDDVDAVAEQSLQDHLGAAIESIPAYIELCRFFLVLAPLVTHAKTGASLCYSTWKSRGWCRVERAARFFSMADSRMLVVRTACKAQVMGAQEALWSHPGAGEFSLSFDDSRVASVMEQLVRGKLQACLAAKDYHGFRVMLNLRQKLFRNLPFFEMDTAGLPPQVKVAHKAAGLSENGWSEYEAFLNLNRIGALNEFSEAGWMPIHYAAVSGNAEILEGILRDSADPGATTAKSDHTHFVEVGSSAISIAAYFHSSRSTVELLLTHGASINRAGNARNSPLLMCALCGNDDCMEFFLERNAAVDQRNLFDNSPLFIAATLSRQAQVAMLLKARASVEINRYGLNPLHQAALSLGERTDASLVTNLIAAGCNLHHRVMIPQRTMHGLVSHTALVTYKHGRKHSFEWISGRINGASPANIASILGNDMVSKAIADLSTGSMSGPKPTSRPVPATPVPLPVPAGEEPFLEM